MQASELRIGNWIVPIMDDGTELEEKQISAREFLAVSDHPEWVKPIQLTKERLLRLGFKNYGLSFSNCDIFSLGDLRILVNRSRHDFAFTHKNISPPSLSICDLQYVHQIQNLVFALTGEELTLINND